MCDPVSIILTTAAVAGAGTFGTGVAGAVEAREQAQHANRLSRANQRLGKSQTSRELHVRTQENARQTFSVAREALAARGSAQASGLGERSIRALTRAISVQENADLATIATNQENARVEAAARLQALELQRASERAQIGSGGVTDLATGVLTSAVAGLTTFASLGSSALMIPGAGGAGAMPSSGDITTPNNSAVNAAPPTNFGVQDPGLLFGGGGLSIPA